MKRLLILGALFCLACAGAGPTGPEKTSPDARTGIDLGCEATKEEAGQHLLTILTDAHPLRYVRPHFECRPDGWVGRVDVDLLHDDDPAAFAAGLLDPLVPALRVAAWHSLVIEISHLPSDLEATALFLEAESDPIRNARSLVMANTRFELDVMGPRSETSHIPRATRLESDVGAILAAYVPPQVQFDVHIPADITRSLDDLFIEDKLKAMATVRVAVEGDPEAREAEITDWIRAVEGQLKPLKQCSFIVSFYTSELAGRPPRSHPLLRRGGWNPLVLPTPAGGLPTPTATRRHDPGPRPTEF